MVRSGREASVRSELKGLSVSTSRGIPGVRRPRYALGAPGVLDPGYPGRLGCCAQCAIRHCHVLAVCLLHPVPVLIYYHVATSGYLIPLSSSFHPHRQRPSPAAQLSSSPTPFDLHPHSLPTSSPLIGLALTSTPPDCRHPKPIPSQPDAIGLWKRTTPRRSSRRSPTCNPWNTTTSPRSMAGPLISSSKKSSGCAERSQTLEAAFKT